MENKHLKYIMEETNAVRKQIQQEQDALWDALDVFDLQPVVPRTLKERVEDLERDALEEALQKTGGNQKHAAAKLGIGRTLLIHKCKKYNINAKDYLLW